jgi:hypothetical protein
VADPDDHFFQPLEINHMRPSKGALDGLPVSPSPVPFKEASFGESHFERS